MVTAFSLRLSPAQLYGLCLGVASLFQHQSQPLAYVYRYISFSIDRIPVSVGFAPLETLPLPIEVFFPFHGRNIRHRDQEIL